MAAHYRDDASPLKIIRQKIAGAEKELATMTAEVSQKTVGVNHMFEALNLRRDGELANQSSLQSRIPALEAAKLKAQAGLAWIDEVGGKTQALEQEEALAASNVSNMRLRPRSCPRCQAKNFATAASPGTMCVTSCAVHHLWAKSRAAAIRSGSANLLASVTT